MNSKPPSPFAVLLVGIVILLIGLGAGQLYDPKRSTVKKQFDAALRGDSNVNIPGVTGYEIRAYEIVNVTDDVVTVRVTFASEAGRDLVKTKKFRVGGGRLFSTDYRDFIDDGR